MDSITDNFRHYMFTVVDRTYHSWCTMRKWWHCVIKMNRMVCAGFMHDLDFERYPDQHCIRSQEIMRERGLDERLIHATASHGYGITVDIVPEHEMEKVLYATDELTGLIGAAALMRPSKSVQDMELKSLKKKYKSSGFAAGCSREVIQRGADMLGWSLDELLTRTLDAMRAVEPVVAAEEA